MYANDDRTGTFFSCLDRGERGIITCDDKYIQAGVLLYGIVQSRFTDHVTKILEFMCVVVPMILACTLFSSSHFVLYGLMIAITACISIRTPRAKQFHSSINNNTAYVSWYRATVLLFTCICILAVDFVVFPRRYGKTETTGTGLMDTGVGCFVFSSALLSRASRGKRDSSFFMTPSRMKRLGQLLTLGFLRVAVHSGIQYQHHVSEYGTHWNFFFTLASLMIFTSLLPVAKYSIILGLGLAFSYEYFLTGMNGTSYMLNAPRVDLLSSNREGILGSLGFMSLYCITVSIGSRYIWRPSSSKHVHIVRELLALSATLWIAYALCDRFISPASRRMVNLTYIVWILAQNVFMLGLFASVQHILSPNVPNSSTLNSLSRNTLSIFLISNLATGLVNLSMNTIESTEPIGFIVIMIYMALVFAYASFIHTSRTSRINSSLKK